MEHVQKLKLIYLNNEGVRRMSFGDSVNAIQCFRNALALIDDPSSNHALSQSPTTTVTEPPLTSWVSISGLNDEAFFIFQQAFLLHPPLPPASDGSAPVESVQRLKAYYNAVLLFNLGLACHQQGLLQQQGLRSSLSSSESMQRAHRFYGHSANLALQLHGSQQQPRDPLASLLLSAAVNNQVHLLFQGHVTIAASAKDSKEPSASSSYQRAVMLSQRVNPYMMGLYATPGGIPSSLQHCLDEMVLNAHLLSSLSPMASSAA